MAQKFKQDLVVLFRAPQEGQDKDPYVQAVESCNKKVVCVPVLGFQFINLDNLYQALCNPEAHSGLILTSPRAVQAVREATKETDWRENQFAAWSKLPVFVVGQTTAQAVRELGLRPIGEDTGSAEALVPVILQEIPPGKPPLLFPCGNLGKETVPSRLRENAVNLENATVYETSAHANIKDSLRGVIDKFGAPQYLVYYSPSGVSFTWPILHSLNVDIGSVKFIAIGATTERALVDKGVRVAGVALKPTPQGLKEAFLPLATAMEVQDM